jgi:hypothetical protein
MRHFVVVTLSLSLLVAAPVLAQQKIEQLAAASSQSAGPLPIGVEADVYCMGWLGQPEEPMTATISGADAMDATRMFGEGDIVYLDIGTARGCLPGQEYWIVRPDRLVYDDPDERDLVGRVYLTPGRLRVICAQEESAIAEVTVSCADLAIGDMILPFEPIPIPLVRRSRPVTSCDPPNGKVVGKIVEVKDYATPIADQSVVFLDLGEKDGVGPGDFLTVYRPRSGGVRTMLGEVAVLTTRSRTATAIVTMMRDNMRVGDTIEPK